MTLVIVFSTIGSGTGCPQSPQIGTDRPWQHMDQMILPTVTLVLGAVPYISRITRASLIEVMESDYVEMARLKGAPERTVMWRHAMPNSLGPVFQVIALNVAYFAGGVIVVEYLFNYPGIGGALQASVRVRDIPVIQFLVMVLAAVYVCTNLSPTSPRSSSPRACARGCRDRHRNRRGRSGGRSSDDRDGRRVWCVSRCGCGARASA